MALTHSLHSNIINLHTVLTPIKYFSCMSHATFHFCPRVVLRRFKGGSLLFCSAGPGVDGTLLAESIFSLV